MSKFSPRLDLQEQYKKYQGVLKNAKQGEVVTRFAPEPSGYLHIGHVKAALITYHYAQMYGGKMILRFDDTNPSKEKQEYVDSIQQDLKNLGISWDRITYTSDNFEYFEEHAVKLIKEGLAYCDNTPVDLMRDQRNEGIESKCRNQSVEENLRLFEGMKNALSPDVLERKIKDKQKAEEMKKGNKTKPAKEEDFTNYAEYCLRAKISMDNKNKCMRDPVLYRCNFIPHHRTGTKYKIYPTYDFCCPLIDSLEGVTHAMRSKEYTDRVAQYEWVIKKCNVRKVNIFEFSRLNFVNVVLSKRKLTWFVQQGLVDGWDDARMPTVRGILRRGLRVESLTEFMLAQGPSKKDNLMEWDKIWATNKTLIDPYCPRFTCLKKEKICNLTVTNQPEGITYTTWPQNPDKKSCPELKEHRPVAISKNIYLDFDDVQNIKDGEKINLMKWGNVKITSKKQNGDSFDLTAEFLPEDKDFSKSVQKISWLSKDSDLVNVNLIELDHLITVDKVEEDTDFESIVNPNTKFVTQYLSEPLLRNLATDDCLQFERRGYYKVDKIKNTKDGDKVLDLIFTPDGKSKAMTANLTQKVDQKQLMSGKQGEDKGANKKELKQKQKDQDTKAAAAKKDKKGGNNAPSGNLSTLHTVQGNFRGNTILIAADIAKQPLAQNNMAWSDLKSKENVQNNPLGQVPFLQTKDGMIYQTSACLRYVALRSKKYLIYGKNDWEKAQIDQWIDFTNTDLGATIRPLLLHIWQWKELSEEQVKTTIESCTRQFNFLNSQLQGKKFLVGNEISIADVFLHSFLVYPFRTYLSAEFRKQNANITAWFEGISENPSVIKYYGKNRYPQQSW